MAAPLPEEAGSDDDSDDDDNTSLFVLGIGLMGRPALAHVRALVAKDAASEGACVHACS